MYSIVSGIGASFFGDILQPSGGGGGQGASMFGQPTAAMSTGKPAGQQQPQKLVAGDLDTSLANLTSNLNLGLGGAK